MRHALIGLDIHQDAQRAFTLLSIQADEAIVMWCTSWKGMQLSRWKLGEWFHRGVMARSFWDLLTE